MTCEKRENYMYAPRNLTLHGISYFPMPQHLVIRAYTQKSLAASKSISTGNIVSTFATLSRFKLAIFVVLIHETHTCFEGPQ